MLIMNVFRDSYVPITHLGGITMSPEFTNFNQQYGWNAIYAGEGGFEDQTSLPDGNTISITWRMPMKAGAMASRNKVIGEGTIRSSGNLGYQMLVSLLGSGTITASGNLGYQILAALSGSGTISDALGNLLISLAAEANISGSGTISEADIKGYLGLVASITGSGDISEAELLAVGELIAELISSGTISSTLLGDGTLSANITSYGSLTPEGLRDAIWNAVATNYNVTGSMGQKLNSAAVGGIDYNALAEAVWDAEVSGRTVGEAGKVLEDIKTKTNMIPGLY